MTTKNLFYTSNPDGCLGHYQYLLLLILLLLIDPILRVTQSKQSHVHFSDSDSKHSPGQDEAKVDAIGIADVEVSLVEQYSNISKAQTKEDGTVSEPVEESEDAMKIRPPKTITELFKNAVMVNENKLAFLAKRPIKETSLEWKSWTWKQYWDDSYLFAKALLNIGVVPFGVVNIIGENSV